MMRTTERVEVPVHAARHQQGSPCHCSSTKDIAPGGRASECARNTTIQLAAEGGHSAAVLSDAAAGSGVVPRTCTCSSCLACDAIDADVLSARACCLPC